MSASLRQAVLCAVATLLPALSSASDYSAYQYGATYDYGAAGNQILPGGCVGSGNCGCVGGCPACCPGGCDRNRSQNYPFRNYGQSFYGAAASRPASYPADRFRIGTMVGACGTTCPTGNCSFSNCPGGVCPTGNCPDGHCVSGQCVGGQCGAAYPRFLQPAGAWNVNYSTSTPSFRPAVYQPYQLK